MPKVVSVRLRHPGQLYDFDVGEMDVVPGDWVIVETVRGQDVGQVIFPAREVPLEEIPGELKPVVRPANEGDFRRMERFREREAEVLARVRAKVAEAGIPMRLVAAEYTYNGRSLTIYFAAEQRVDFRELVKDLAREFRARIELRQIGARDEAKLLGGIGCCGRELCCATWLQDFLRISVRMAKDQDLPLSPMKISGVCGRLLCCLSYECDQYREIKAHLPEVGQEVVTLRGRGRVVAVSVPRESVTVELRPGVTVDVGGEELDRAGRLEAEGRLPAAQPAVFPVAVGLEAEPAAVQERAVVATAALTEAELARRHRKRRRRKPEGGGAAAPRAQATPEQPRERPRPAPGRGEQQRRPAEGQRRRGPPRREHGAGRPGPEARPPAGERKPPEAQPRAGGEPSPRRRRPRRRLPREGGPPAGGQ